MGAHWRPLDGEDRVIVLVIGTGDFAMWAELFAALLAIMAVTGLMWNADRSVDYWSRNEIASSLERLDYRLNPCIARNVTVAVFQSFFSSRIFSRRCFQGSLLLTLGGLVVLTAAGLGGAEHVAKGDPTSGGGVEGDGTADGASPVLAYLVTLAFILLAGYASLAGTRYLIELSAIRNVAMFGLDVAKSSAMLLLGLAPLFLLELFAFSDARVGAVGAPDDAPAGAQAVLNAFDFPGSPLDGLPSPELMFFAFFGATALSALMFAAYFAAFCSKYHRVAHVLLFRLPTSEKPIRSISIVTAVTVALACLAMTLLECAARLIA